MEFYWQIPYYVLALLFLSLQKQDCKLEKHVRNLSTRNCDYLHYYFIW